MLKFKVLRAISDICTGCRTCEILCSLNKTGRVNPLYARIRVRQPSEDSPWIHNICHHCGIPRCKEACPVPGAMYPDEQTGTMVIDENKCIRCRACMEACPFEAIQIGPKGEVLKCDLCGGDPVCVKFCEIRPEEPLPHLLYPAASCLEYVEPHRVTRKRLVPRVKGVTKSMFGPREDGRR